MKEINSKENSSVKEYVKLVNSKKERVEKGKFTVEGVKIVLEAYNSGYLNEAFATVKAYEKYADKLSIMSEKVTLITEEIEKKFATTKTPQGVFGVCSIKENSLTEESVVKSGKYVFLCDLQDNGNVGTIIRTADAVGIDGVILSKNTCDIYSPKTIKATMGSLFRVSFLKVEDIESFLKYLSTNNVMTVATVPDNNAETITEFDFKTPCVALIGNEGNGLTEDIVNSCTDKVTIKMCGNIESLNASVAATLTMWEMTKRR